MNQYLKENINEYLYGYLYHEKMSKVGKELCESIQLYSFEFDLPFDEIPEYTYLNVDRYDDLDLYLRHPIRTGQNRIHCCLECGMTGRVGDQKWHNEYESDYVTTSWIFTFNPNKCPCEKIPLPDRYWFTYPTKKHLKEELESFE